MKATVNVEFQNAVHLEICEIKRGRVKIQSIVANGLPITRWYDIGDTQTFSVSLEHVQG